jgi:hypothetical protein
MSEPAVVTQGDWQEALDETPPRQATDPVSREPWQPMVLIGLAGRAGVGKDTVAEFWADEHFILRAGFANPIKHALAVALGLPIGLFYDRDVKEKQIDWLGKSPRELMQLFGTEFGRERLGEDVWIRVADRMLDGLMGAPEYDTTPAIVWTDVRMDNEADWIRSRNGWIVHVVRPDAAPVAEHASEKGVTLKAGDIVIRNVSDLDHLAEVADSVFRSIVETEHFLAEVEDSETTEVREDNDDTTKAPA